MASVLFNNDGFETERKFTYREELKTPKITIIDGNKEFSKRRILDKAHLSFANMLLMSLVFLLIFVQACFYYEYVSTSAFSNLLQRDINKAREVNYELKVELEKTKELSSVENMATKLYSMRTAENVEIKYLPMPKEIKETDLQMINKTLNKEKDVSVPIGF